MIIITGSIIATDATVDELISNGLEHTRRSRLEPGCLSHSVSRDVEDPNRILFYERWVDMDAVKQHFGVQASVDFVRLAVSLADAPPTLELFDATLTTA